MKLGRTAGPPPAWTTPDMVCHHGGYIIHDGYIYGNNDSGWACLDWRPARRSGPKSGVGKGSLCWADGMLYLFSENGGQAALATCSPEGLNHRPCEGRGRRPQLGPSRGHRRPALPPLRHQALLLRRAGEDLIRFCPGKDGCRV